MSKLLEVKNLKTQFFTQDGVVHAVNGITYSVGAGETVAIVGESGSGKSVGVMSLIRLIPQPPGKIVDGEVWFDGQDLLKVSEDDLRRIRGNRIAMIFQDPMTSLNPVLTIGRQITEALELHLDMNKEQARKRAVELLELVGIPGADARLDDYPHQFSGGMRQRVMIAIGLSCNPQLLIADEPTTALDVTIQAQIVDLVTRLRNELGMAVIWITHDLGVVAGMAERVIVMYSGFIVEESAVDQIYADPRHPYTLGLLRSIPRLDLGRQKRLIPIEGLPPDLLEPPAHCPFAPRCFYAEEKCWQENPTLELVAPDHRTACWPAQRGVKLADLPIPEHFNAGMGNQQLPGSTLHAIVEEVNTSLTGTGSLGLDMAHDHAQQLEQEAAQDAAYRMSKQNQDPSA